MEHNDNFLPSPYHISFGIQDDFVRGNIFRPVQPYNNIIPHIEMIMPPINWIGYAIYLVKKNKIPREGDCLFLDPDHGEFCQAILWKLYGDSDLVIGRDWACTREREWFFNSTTSGRQRGWPDNICSFIKTIETSKHMDITNVINDFASILGSLFIRTYVEITESNFKENIRNNLMPQLMTPPTGIPKEKIKIYLAQVIFKFLRDSFLEVRSKIIEKYSDDEIPSRYQKFLQTDIVETEYGMIDFLRELFDINPDDNNSLGTLDVLGEIVNRYSSPFFKSEEIDIIFSRLNNTDRGRTLITSFILVDYAVHLLIEKRGKSDLQSIIDDLDSDEIFIECLEQMLSMGEKRFQTYCSDHKNIFLKNINRFITFDNLEKIIYYWLFNFFVYYGEIIIRNDVKRERIVDQGVSEKDIVKLLENTDFEKHFLKKFLTNVYPKLIQYLDVFESDITDIERDTYVHLKDFLKILKEGLSKKKKDSAIFFELLKTDKSLEKVSEKLVANADSKDRFNKLTDSVVFPGRNNITWWYSQLMEMRIKSYE